jgi:dihydrofolate synthase/folylpolyglutamate synthase
LLPHFEAVEHARGDVSLTYFEFTTLAIARLLSMTPLDMVILEVGLGGRLDAVNTIDTDCAIITSIDIDHTEYLGETREKIGFEKAGIMRPGKPAIVSDPVPPRSVVERAMQIGADLWLCGRDFTATGDQLQWNWAGRGKRFSGLAYPALRGANQLLNASGVLAAFDAMHQRLPINAQAVRNGLALVELPGRFQVVAGRPTLVLDVSHNRHAVANLLQSLDRMGYHPRTFAVFGAMHDKDIAGMLTLMAPVVDRWLFTDLPTPRAASAAQLAAVHGGLSLKGPGQVLSSCHADPAAALGVALEQADPADRIVIFGSFATVGSVLKSGLPRRAGQHLG